MEFKQAVVTKQGRELMAKLLAGKTTKFTKVKVSSTVYQDGQLENLTALTNVKQESTAQAFGNNTATVSVVAAIENTGLATGYYINTVGLYAQDPDKGEILYSVSSASVNGYMPPDTGVSKSGFEFKIYTEVGNASKVDLTVDPAAYATRNDIVLINQTLADHANDKNNPHKVTADQTGAYTKAESDISALEIALGVKTVDYPVVSDYSNKMFGSFLECPHSLEADVLSMGSRNVLLQSGNFKTVGISDWNIANAWSPTISEENTLKVTIPSAAAQYMRLKLSVPSPYIDKRTVLIRARASRDFTFKPSFFEGTTAVGGQFLFDLTTEFQTIATTVNAYSASSANYFGVSSTTHNSTHAGVEIEFEFLYFSYDDTNPKYWLPAEEDLENGLAEVTQTMYDAVMIVGDGKTIDLNQTVVGKAAELFATFDIVTQVENERPDLIEGYTDRLDKAKRLQRITASIVFTAFAQASGASTNGGVNRTFLTNLKHANGNFMASSQVSSANGIVKCSSIVSGSSGGYLRDDGTIIGRVRAASSTGPEIPSTIKIDGVYLVITFKVNGKEELLRLFVPRTEFNLLFDRVTALENK